MGTAVAERQRPKRIWSGTWICRQEWEQGPVKLLCISLFCKGSFYFSSHKVLVVFGSISGKSSDRDELFLNQISKGFGTSVLSHNMKCGFLFSIFIWIDINECLKKITISAFSVVIWYIFVCLMLMQIVDIVLANLTWCLPRCLGWGVARGRLDSDVTVTKHLLINCNSFST